MARDQFPIRPHNDIARIDLITEFFARFNKQNGGILAERSDKSGYSNDTNLLNSLFPKPKSIKTFKGIPPLKMSSKS